MLCSLRSSNSTRINLDTGKICSRSKLLKIALPNYVIKNPHVIDPRSR